MEFVMPGLDPGIHVLAARTARKTWMAGSSPAMTKKARHIWTVRKNLKMLAAFSVGPRGASLSRCLSKDEVADVENALAAPMD
jgi:hypothetical protein